MVRKPTTPFGGIIFGKDGTVTPDFHRLPDDKSGQERFVAEDFARRISGPTVPNDLAVRPLDENNHDFVLMRGEVEWVIVQMTEIVWRDYASPITEEDYLSGNFTGDVIVEGPGKYLIVDRNKRDAVICEKISRKIAKKYQKPSDTPLWLLIWSVRTELNAFYFQNGQAKVELCVDLARRYADSSGCGPFDQIWFINMNAPNPHRIV